VFIGIGVRITLQQGPVFGGAAPALLLESGSYLLLESGDKLLLE
jgi:hypothetical protein